MPVTKQTYLHEMCQRTKACISRYEQLRMVDDEKMATVLGINIRTLRNKRAHPDMFTLGELRMLSRYLKCPIEELCGGDTPEEMTVKVIAAAMKKGN